MVMHSAQHFGARVSHHVLECQQPKHDASGSADWRLVHHAVAIPRSRCHIGFHRCRLRSGPLGRSTKTIDDFISLLSAHHIVVLIDVCTVPRSRHNPQFNTDTLATSLKTAGLTYVHMPQLGGLRKAKKDLISLGWRNESFRGYADYMQTDEFLKAIEELMADSQLRPTTILCTQAVPLTLSLAVRMVAARKPL